MPLTLLCSSLVFEGYDVSMYDATEGKIRVVGNNERLGSKAEKIDNKDNKKKKRYYNNTIILR